jgi:hypothetical protein
VAEITQTGGLDLMKGVRPWAIDADNAKALWAKSEEWTGEKF